jgi:purine-cytosine permease-like protein
MASSRAPFGANANRAISVFNYGTILGYEILDLAIITLALLAVFAEAGVEASTGLKLGMITVAFALQIPLPLYGHATVMKAMKVLSVVFVAFTIVLAILVAGKVDLGTLEASGGFAAISVALAFVVSVGGLGWANYAGDYSRYIPATASRSQVFLWTFLGAAVPSILLEVLGAAIGTTFPAGDVVSGLREALPSWFAVPYLLLVVAMLVAITSTGYYSSALTLQAMGIKLKRWKGVMVDFAITIAPVVLIIFSETFNRYLTDFVLLQLIWLSPWAGIYLVDFLLRRGIYDPLSLFSGRQGIYWRNGGFHWPAVIAQAAGMLAATLWIVTPAYTGPLANLTGGSDLSIFAGGLVAAILYLALAGSRVRDETRRTIAEGRANTIPQEEIPSATKVTLAETDLG